MSKIVHTSGKFDFFDFFQLLSWSFPDLPGVSGTTRNQPKIQTLSQIWGFLIKRPGCTSMATPRAGSGLIRAATHKERSIGFSAGGMSPRSPASAEAVSNVQQHMKCHRKHERRCKRGCRKQEEMERGERARVRACVREVEQGLLTNDSRNVARFAFKSVFDH